MEARALVRVRGCGLQTEQEQRDPWESQAWVVVSVKDSKVPLQPLMAAKRNISSSCSQL